MELNATAKMRTPQVLALLVLLAALGLRILLPALEDTSAIKKETKALRETITHLNEEISAYDSTWEKRITESERQIQIQIPDTLNSANVIDYFITEFQKAHLNDVRFSSVTLQTNAASDIRMQSGQEWI